VFGSTALAALAYRYVPNMKEALSWFSWKTAFKTCLACHIFVRGWSPKFMP
jgi:hypothetical protein